VSVGVEQEGLRALLPEPQFEITGAAHVAFAAAPTMLFSATASEPNGFEVQSIALTVQVMIDPARRGYDPETRERLAELFGPPASWAPSTSGLAWARVAATVPGFSGTTAFGLEVPCTYDLEVAAAKYFYALEDGQVPLTFHFNGNVFYRSPASAASRLQVVPVSWSNSAHYTMGIEVWRSMIAEHYPGGGWIRVGDQTLAALNQRRSARGLPSFDACVQELLEGTAGD
jgi:Family of unknown function (DUF6084)